MSFRELQLAKIPLNFKSSCCNLKIRGLGAKLCLGFLLFSFWKELWCFYRIIWIKPKSPCILMNKNINFNQNEKESEMENLSDSSRSLCFGSHKKCKLKVKLWWAGTCKKKKRTFFVPFVCPKKFFEHFSFILMYNVLNTLSEYTYFYTTKNINSDTFFLVFKVVESIVNINKNS